MANIGPQLLYAMDYAYFGLVLVQGLKKQQKNYGFEITSFVNSGHGMYVAVTGCTLQPSSKSHIDPVTAT